MTVYLGMMAILSICSFVEVICHSGEQKNWRNKNYITTFVSYLTLFIVLIAHDEWMGVDSKNYEIMFKDAQNATWVELFQMEEIDYGYYSINKIIGYFTDDFWIVRGVLHTITLSLIFFVLNKETKYPSLGVLIYFTVCHFYIFYILREALAISIGMLSYYFLKRNKNIIFFLLAFWASTIHVTGILVFVFILLRRFLKKKIKLYQLWGMSFLTLIVSYFGLVCIMSFYRNGRYLEMEKDGGLSLLLVLAVIMIGISYFISKYRLRDIESSFRFNLLCCSMLIQVMALYAGILTRARFYFAVFMILLIPDILGMIKDVSNRMVYCILVIGACWGWVFVVSDLYPYTFHTF